MSGAIANTLIWWGLWGAGVGPAPAATSTAALVEAERALAEGHPQLALARVGEPGGALADHARWLRARIHLASGRPAAARAELAAIAEPVPNAELRRARSAALAEALEADDPGQAIERWLEDPDDPERWARALALAEARAPERVPAIERRLLVERPSFPAAKARPLEAVRRLSLDERRRRARLLLDLHENELAHAEATELLALLPRDAPRCELRYVAGRAARKLRKYGLALEHLPAAERVCRAERDDDLAARAWLLEVQVRRIRGQLAELRALLDRPPPDPRLVDDAVLELAELELSSGAADAAEARLARLLTDLPDADQAPRIAWILAELARATRPAAAAEWLRRSAASPHALPDQRARAGYVLAELAREGGAAPEAVCAALGDVVLGGRPTIYAHLALAAAGPSCRARLEKELLARVRASPSPRPPWAHAAAPEVRLARALHAAGYPEHARAELERLDRPGASEDDVLGLALALDAVDAHREAQLLLRARASRALEGPIDARSLPLFRAAYSRAYAAELERAASAEKLDPLLLTALVREESTFDPEIVSWAGAVGLAQLMPSTAIGAYADLRLPGKLELARLVEPELNARLGARVLKTELRRFGAAPLAIAAYNAGGGLVKRTLRGTATPFSTWLERVPVRETRRYVRRVVETWGVYRLLYDAARPLIELPATVGP